jgi:FkbM family methyltransferase
VSRHVAAAVGAVARGLTAGLAKWPRVATRAQVAAALVPRVKAATARGPLTFYTPSKTAIFWPRYGVKAEPQTHAWIDRMAAGEVFWDIGASVGIYSLYAALRGDLTVLAFEANPYTYQCLLRNVAENRLGGRVQPYCVALAQDAGLGTLYVESDEAGTVGNAFGDPKASQLRADAGAVHVPMIALSLDALAGPFGAPFPNHIKIDVDSIEDKIVAGGGTVLGDARLRSLMIELHRDIDGRDARSDAIVARMAAHGFHIAEGEGVGEINYVFRRD